jgi:hypothetical protein
VARLKVVLSGTTTGTLTVPDVTGAKRASAGVDATATLTTFEEAATSAVVMV